MLWHPNDTDLISIHTDACEYGMGVIVSQKILGVDRPIGFYSKIFTDSERKRPILHKEIHAVYFGIQKARNLVYNRYFRVFTDNAPARSIFSSEISNPVIARYQLALDGFDFEIFTHLAVKMLVLIS